MFFNKSLIAIDIGSSSIKMVELSGSNEKTLRTIGLEVLPEGAVFNGVIQDLAVVEQVAKSLIKKMKIMTTGRKVAISIGGNSVLIKKVGFLPASTKEEFTEQIFYEAEQHFQHSLDELEVDYFELSDKPGPDGMIPVLLVGAKKEMVEQYLTLVRNLGMRTAVIDCDVFSIANMFEYNFGQVEGLTALINVGSCLTQITLLGNGQFLFTRDISYGGDEYTRRIMDNLNIDKASAEAMKIAASDSSNVQNNVQEIIRSVNDQIVSEVQLTLDYFFQSGEMAENLGGISSAFLSGGGSKVLGLDAALAATLQAPVQIINSFHRIEVNSKKIPSDYIFSQGHMYGNAVGLALRSLKDSQN